MAKKYKWGDCIKIYTKDKVSCGDITEGITDGYTDIWVQKAIFNKSHYSLGRNFKKEIKYDIIVSQRLSEEGPTKTDLIYIGEGFINVIFKETDMEIRDIFNAIIEKTPRSEILDDATKIIKNIFPDQSNYDCGIVNTRQKPNSQMELFN